MTTPTVVGGTTLCVRAWLGVVAHLLQDAHSVGHAPVLAHLAPREPGNVDHVDADRLPGRRVAELPGAAVGPAGPDPQPHLVADRAGVLDGVVQVRDAGPQGPHEHLELISGKGSTGAAVRGELVVDELRR